MIHFVKLFNLERIFLCLSGLTLKFRIGKRFFRELFGAFNFDTSGAQSAVARPSVFFNQTQYQITLFLR